MIDAVIGKYKIYSEINRSNLLGTTDMHGYENRSAVSGGEKIMIAATSSVTTSATEKK